jgi:uncharacterized cupredoxin-like copper-binding protein
VKKQSTIIPGLALMILASVLTIASPAALAHGDAPATKDKVATPISTEEHAFGKEGDPQHVSRTITVDLNDTMRFNPSEIKVKQGETIKFIVRNKGQAKHEMVLGTLPGLKEHGELMKANPEMGHEESYMAHVKPGAQQEMVWQFTKAGEFNFGCLAPGHFEAGMVGKIKVVKG